MSTPFAVRDRMERNFRHRVFLPDVSVHVIQRGVNHADIFDDQIDHECFLALLAQACSASSVQIHGYVLMTTHFHLIATPGDPKALPAAMQQLGAGYVRYFNRRYHRVGALWNGRYRALPLLDERYWLTCLRYVEQNPVRARMVPDPSDYRWSSYRAHAFGQPIDWLTPHHIYTSLGSTPDERQTAYQALCGTPLGKPELAWERRSPSIALSEMRS